MAILHRKNSLSYKTLNGARTGDLFMSLIHTCRLNAANPFDYLLAIATHSRRGGEIDPEGLAAVELPKVTRRHRHQLKRAGLPRRPCAQWSSPSRSRQPARNSAGRTRGRLPQIPRHPHTPAFSQLCMLAEATRSFSVSLHVFAVTPCLASASKTSKLLVNSKALRARLDLPPRR